jgi:hypothetical protein
LESVPICITCDSNIFYIFADRFICISIDEKIKRSAVSIQQTKHYSDILAHCGLLYACVQNEPKITVIELKNFKIIKEYELIFVPFQIQAIGNVVCVRSQPKQSSLKTIFLNLNTFEVVSQFDHLNGYIFVFNEKFYIFQNDDLNMFSKDGLFLKKYAFKQGFGQIFSIVNLNENILFCLKDKLVIFYTDYYIRKYLN